MSFKINILLVLLAIQSFSELTKSNDLQVEKTQNITDRTFPTYTICQSYHRSLGKAETKKAALKLKGVLKMVLGLKAKAAFHVANSAKWPSRKSCGTSKKYSEKRIVGGKLANKKDWPWMAAILNTAYKRPFCGGTLITDRHILTAAHCFDTYKISDVILRLGVNSFDDDKDGNSTDFNVTDLRMHPEYNYTTNQNDIAILKLDRPTTFSELIHPVCLPPPNNEFEDKFGYVIGWGRLYHGGPTSKILREVLLPIWKQLDCVKAFEVNKVVKTMLCAGDPDGGKDSCQGDSGGPLLIQIPPETRWHIAGIVSFGILCGLPNKPGVYTRVNMYLNWIKENAIF